MQLHLRRLPAASRRTKSTSSGSRRRSDIAISHSHDRRYAASPAIVCTNPTANRGDNLDTVLRLDVRSPHCGCWRSASPGVTAAEPQLSTAPAPPGAEGHEEPGREYRPHARAAA
jgi:hypothetical protein